MTSSGWSPFLGVLGLGFASLIAGPYVVWVRGTFGIAYRSSLRWPPERPPGLDRLYRYDAGDTTFQAMAGAGAAVLSTQLLWWEQPWWVFLAAWIIAVARSTWMGEADPRGRWRVPTAQPRRADVALDCPERHRAQGPDHRGEHHLAPDPLNGSRLCQRAVLLAHAVDAGFRGRGVRAVGTVGGRVSAWWGHRNGAARAVASSVAIRTGGHPAVVALGIRMRWP